MSEEEFYWKQDKEELVSICEARDNKIEYLQQRIDNAINYIKWHYDLGTKDNVEFCLLRDRLLEILGDKENERFNP